MSDQIKSLKDTLFYTNKSAYATLGDEELERSFAYAEAYKLFLDMAKTEREAVKYSADMLRRAGFVEYALGDDMIPGGKYFLNNRGKAIFAFKVGTNPIEGGVNIVAAHIDTPRIDIKPNPLYEDSGMGFFKTHYYGGIKKYQWTAIPLSLHGVIVTADGREVEVNIGEDADDPVFCVNDLLPHLAQEQMKKSAAEFISGEGMNILLGSEPYRGEFKDGEYELPAESIKLNLINILHSKYGITEHDFLSAELTAVPAFKARDIGLDRSLIGAYGHDDRSCAYAALTAIIDTSGNGATADESTSIVILADKEETGSDGVSGLRSSMLKDLIMEIADKMGGDEIVVRQNSRCLSADVTVAFDPHFSEVHDRRNAAFINCGVSLMKHTGSRGKSGTSDATAEFVGKIRRMLDAEGVVWQLGELGKVDAGGGGTVAMYVANLNIDTVDIGVPVLSMHAPYEAISKLDLYMTYRACKIFMGCQ